MGHIGRDKPAATCVGCFAWGQLPGRFCRACYTYRQLNALGVCLICRRDIPVNDGHCRLCRAQASWAVKAAGATGEAAALAIFLRGVKHQQLFFANLQRPRNGGPPVGKQGRRVRKRAADVEPVRLHSPWVQPRLTEAPQDFSRFARHRRDLANPTLDQARRRASAIGEAHGWTRWVTREVDRALIILLSGHQAGDKISYSQMSDGLRHFGLERLGELLPLVVVVPRPCRPPLCRPGVAGTRDPARGPARHPVRRSCRGYDYCVEQGQSWPGPCRLGRWDVSFVVSPGSQNIEQKVHFSMNSAKKAALVLATAGLAAGAAAGSAAADAAAEGAAVGSPGVLSGNLGQYPVHVPINICGNTANLVGALNPAFGNFCANG